MFGPWAPLAVPSARLSASARKRVVDCVQDEPLGRPVTEVEDSFGWLTASLRPARRRGGRRVTVIARLYFLA